MAPDSVLSGTLLAIETSCDETAAAVLGLDGVLRSSVITSQVDVHAPYGGVVPELAARRHIESIDVVVRKALQDAGETWENVRAIAATQGPGLAGALLVGLSYAKACAYARRIPLLLVNHLQGHIASAWIDRPEFPRQAVILIVSGGHTHLYRTDPSGRFALLGRTLDDAAGEAFDKAAKLLGLGYPGGPLIDRLAQGGNPGSVRFPRSMRSKKSLDFSFSGLKTSLLYYLRDHADWGRPDRMADIAAGFQEAIVDVLTAKALEAVRREKLSALAVVGGVSANSRLRARLAEETTARGIHLSIPRLVWCTDNAAMIAAAGLEAYHAGRCAAWDAEAEADLPFTDSGPAGCAIRSPSASV